MKSYPFLPYQFTLVQKILNQFANMEQIGAHLSQGGTLDAKRIQNAANAVAEKELGTLVPLL